MDLTSICLADQFSQFIGVEAFVAAGDAYIKSSPYEWERSFVRSAVESRRREFFSGRYYAREALQRGGYPSAVIMRGIKGDPLWPNGVKGSITHDLQKVMAVVVSDPVIKGIGIDLILKPSDVEGHLQPLIATHSELFCLEHLNSRISPLALAFGLKESVVKALSPSIDYYLDFLDITISIDGDCLNARLLNIDAVLFCKVFELKEGFVTLSVWKSGL